MSRPHRIVRFPGAYFAFSALLTVSVMAVAGWLAERDFERGLEAPLEAALGSYAATLEGGTINSRAMGAAILFGLENKEAKAAASGRLPPGDPRVLADLELLRTTYLADVALLANSKGTVIAYRNSDDVRGTGADLSFRPYVQRALLGMANVYPAVGILSPQRGIFLSAPLHAGTAAASPVIGAVVVRVGADKLDMLLRSWTGGAVLLLSPQGIVFASSRDDWLFHSGTDMDAGKLDELRRSRQFGGLFARTAPAPLPFSLDTGQTSVDGVPYAVRSIALDWDDPNGDWRLTFLARRPPWWTRVHVLGLAAIAGLVTALLTGWYYVMTRNAYALDVMNARLRKSDELLKESQEIAGLGTYTLDIASGRWESSELLDHLFGIDAAYVRSIEGWAQLIHPDDREAVLQHLQQDVIGRRRALNREFRIVTRDGGRVRWVHGLGKLELDAAGNPVELHGTVQDISERKRAEEEISQSLRMLEDKELAKTRFLAAAGHDLRQPLAAANLFIDALKTGPATPHQEKIISRLEQAMITFNGLLDTLLNISRLDAGVIKPEPEPINATELANWLEQSFAPLAVEKRIAFRLHFPMTKPLAIHGDPGLVRSALMNLVSNAIKFTAQGGVLVSIRRRGGEALFQVWDTGVGIEAEHLERVFDEFYQIGNPQRDRSQGLGLGLSIAQRAIGLMGSTVTCRSQSGRGSVFAFRLPLAQHGEAKEGGGAQAAGPGFSGDVTDTEFARGKHFVVVEDDALVAQGLVTWLEGMGGRVTSFHCAEDALNRRDIAEADYYIVDYMLSGRLSGIHFLNALALQAGRGICAVLVTGDTSPAFFREAASLAWPVLHKPVQISGLAAALRAQSR